MKNKLTIPPRNKSLEQTKKIFGLELTIYQFYCFGVSIIAALIAITISILSLKFLPSGSFQLQLILFISSAFIGFAASLFASVSVIYLYDKHVKVSEQDSLTESLSGRLVSDIKEEIEDIEKRYCTAIYSNFPLYLPEKYFPRSQETTTPDCPSLDFVKLIEESFIDSSQYLFKGVLGMWIPVYLERFVKNPRLRIQILLFDPTEDSVLKDFAINKYKDTTLNNNEKLARIKKRSYQTIVGLFDVAQEKSLKIDISLYRDFIFYRSEIFDKRIIITFYNENDPESGTYPSAYSYSNKSIFYSPFLNDFNKTQTFNQDANKRVTFTSDLDEDALQNFLTEISCNETIQDLRNGYADKKKRIIGNLNTLGYR